MIIYKLNIIYFIGKENEINALNEKEKIKSFSQISLEKDNNFGIWKIILNDWK